MILDNDCLEVVLCAATGEWGNYTTISRCMMVSHSWKTICNRKRTLNYHSWVCRHASTSIPRAAVQRIVREISKAGTRYIEPRWSKDAINLLHFEMESFAAECFAQAEQSGAFNTHEPTYLAPEDEPTDTEDDEWFPPLSLLSAHRLNED